MLPLLFGELVIANHLPGGRGEMHSEDVAASPEPSSGQASHESGRIKIRFIPSDPQNIHHWLLLNIFSL